MKTKKGPLYGPELGSAICFLHSEGVQFPDPVFEMWNGIS